MRNVPTILLPSHRDGGGGDGLGGVLVEEHAVGGRHHVLAGHQGPAAELVPVGQEGGHPGVLVLLETRKLLLRPQSGLTHRVHLGTSHDPGGLLHSTFAD